MSVTTNRSTIAELIDSFATAAPDLLCAEYQRLVGELWCDGELSVHALPAVPALVSRFDEVDDQRAGYLAILLGLLAEAEYPVFDGEVSAAVRRGLDHYLDRWSAAPAGEPLSLALLYLVAHFPGDRDRILAVAAGLGLERDDLSRFDRALRELDEERPVIGRVFPSPAVWQLNETERDFDQGFITGLTPEQVRVNWEKDTRTVLGHQGAKAYWAVRNGTPAPTVSATFPNRDEIPVPPVGAGIDQFARHAGALRCPQCHAKLDFADSGIRCTACAAAYPATSGILNLLAESYGDKDDFLNKLAEVPSMGYFYEAFARPAFLRISGSNWGAAVTVPDEDAYIAEHVRPVDGPVLDLAAGAGRWTSVLAKHVGPERLIALDMAPPMLTALRALLPEVPAVLASGGDLPFDDASLGAVLCWNALQAFPAHAAAAIAEVGRCLRPGGTFTLLTFRMDTDRIARHFQAAHHFPGHADGLRLFDLDELKSWLTDAGLTVRHESTPGTFILITAERPA
jgi:SAM-dependent methyltransferase